MEEKEKKDQTKGKKLQDVVGTPYFKIAVTVVIIGLLAWGIYEGWRHLSIAEEFKVGEVMFVIRPEGGVKEALLKEVKDTRRIIGRRLFDKGLPQEVARRLEEIPWVKRVPSVKREFPGRLRIQLEMRQAVAVLKKDDAFYLLDEEGMVLPEAYFSWPRDQKETPYIESKRLRFAPGAGQRLEDKGILAGIELLGFLKENEVHKMVSLRAVDVTGVGWGRSRGESDIVIWTQGGTAIKWGCPPLCGHVDELSNEQKLQNLVSIIRAEGARLDQMEYVDVRWKLPRGKKKEEKELSVREKRKSLEGI
jgi:hypothetical protein